MSARSDDNVIPFEKSASAHAARSGPKPHAPAVAGLPVKELRCPACGYSMKGLRALRCPECGKPVSAGPVGRSGDAGVSQQRREIRKALLMLAIGLAGVFSIVGATHGLQGMIVYLIVFAISVPCGIAAYWLCCLLWVGFDEPMPMVALKLAGIYAVVDLLGQSLAFVPMLNIGIMKLAITGVAYIGLLMSMLELDQADAIGVAIATFLVKALAVFLILMFLIPAFGLII